MSSAKALIPSSAHISRDTCLIGTMPPTFIFNKAGRIHLRPYPPPQDRKHPPGMSSFPPPIVYGNPGEWKQGMEVAKFSKQGEGMEGADQMVFSQLGTQSIDLWICLPGYEEVDFCKAYRWGGKTKCQIGHEICTVYLPEFMRYASRFQPKDKGAPVIGKDIVWDQLVLLEIIHHSGQVWQLNLAYDSVKGK